MGGGQAERAAISGANHSGPETALAAFEEGLRQVLTSRPSSSAEEVRIFAQNDAEEIDDDIEREIESRRKAHQQQPTPELSIAKKGRQNAGASVGIGHLIGNAQENFSASQDYSMSTSVGTGKSHFVAKGDAFDDAMRKRMRKEESSEEMRTASLKEKTPAEHSANPLSHQSDGTPRETVSGSKNKKGAAAAVFSQYKHYGNAEVSVKKEEDAEKTENAKQEDAAQEWEEIAIDSQPAPVIQSDAAKTAKAGSIIQPKQTLDYPEFIRTVIIPNLKEVQLEPIKKNPGQQCCVILGMQKTLRDDLRPELQASWELVTTDYEPDQFDFHYRTLLTIYRKLTRDKRGVETIGGHWNVIGFQGSDPRTDLNRFGGLANVIHLLHFCSMYFDVLEDIYMLSHDPEQEFPLVLVSINFTQVVSEILYQNFEPAADKISQASGSWKRSHFKLLAWINKLESSHPVFDGAAFLHNACLWSFYRIWQDERCTIGAFHNTLKRVKAILEKDLGHVLRQFQDEIDQRRGRNDPANLEFTELGQRESGAKVICSDKKRDMKLANYAISENQNEGG